MILSPIKERLFRVAILGKPNVGKSTLFNRLLDRRRAITDPAPGVTRDPVEAACLIKGSRIHLVDTGGYKVEMDDLEKEVRDLSVKNAENADLIFFLVDVKEELNREDHEFIEVLRKYQEKIILVVNKVDNTKLEQSVWNFMELGFNHVVWISAVHGKNIESLKNLIFKKYNESFQEEAPIPKPVIRLTILGKPNTGKSTLLNYLLDEQKSIVSKEPGTTRDTIEGFFRYRDATLKVIDTAGIRRKPKVTDSVEYYAVNRAIKSINEADIVLLLIDAGSGLSDQDKKIASLIVKKGKGIILVLNKWDLLKSVPNQFQAVQDRIRFLFPILGFSPILPLSALTGEGVEKVLATVLIIWRQLNLRVTTPVLNRKLKQWLIHYPLPTRG
ncbi:MAG: ribosome biogenesis GTPase Der, partial [Spirochaeta sp.]|nr:ribosome biogenesis GTPase Der [Spirochaeta sp.]